MPQNSEGKCVKLSSNHSLLTRPSKDVLASLDKSGTYTSYTWYIYHHIPPLKTWAETHPTPKCCQLMAETAAPDSRSSHLWNDWGRRTRPSPVPRWCPNGRSHSNSPVLPFQLEGGFQNSINYRYNRWYINKHVYLYIYMYIYIHAFPMKLSE